ncbi:MAG: nucleoside monophosphate kinase, partial [Patescibacteria group bacterium]
DCEFGFLLDGYPRTLEQANVIDANSDLDYVFLINVSDETVVERISGRRVCKNGHTWHLKYAPSKAEGVCDTCGESLFQRDDDKEEVVKSRLDVFHTNMEPILKFFEDKGMLIKVNGEQHIEGVFQEMVRRLVYDLREKTLR